MAIDRLTGLDSAPLSHIELATLGSKARGLSNKEISQVLGAQKSQIKTILGSLKANFSVSNNDQLISKAIDSGVIRKPSNWVRGANLPPHNPFMGPPGTSSMHANAASSDATLNPGPGTSGNYQYKYNDDQTILQTKFEYALPTVMMPENGSLLGVGVGNAVSNKEIPTVLLISPFSLEILDSVELQKPESGNLAGGVYSYIDNDNNLVLVDSEGNLRWFNSTYNLATDSGEIVESKPSIPIGQPLVVGLVPDYEGRIWYATQGGSTPPVVGFYDQTTSTSTSFNLPAGEMVANSISSSPAGVAVASTKALYLFRYSKKADQLKQVWRYEYENSGLRKPGQLSAGTGATPVFFGPKTGFEYIAITDNGATNNGETPAENFNIFKTAKVAPTESQLVGSVPFLTPSNSGTENAPIGVGKYVFSPSSYGYWYPPSSQNPKKSTPKNADFVGGAQMIKMTKDSTTKVKSWTSDWSIQDVTSTALPRLSIADGQIYTVVGEYSSNAFTNKVNYFFAAIDPATGTYQKLSDTSLQDNWGSALVKDPSVFLPNEYNNNTLQMTGVISPDGVFYQGMAAGIFSVEGPRARFGTGIAADGYSFANSVSYDGDGYAYSANAINAADSSGWQGPRFDIQGQGVNGLNFTWANGQTILIDGTGDNTLTLFGSAVNGSLEGVEIVISYTDGTTSTWTQDFSDWADYKQFAGESIYSTQSYRNYYTGISDPTSNNIYGYQYSLEAAFGSAVAATKEIESITLPFESNLRILDVDTSLMSQVDLSPNTFGITTPPWQVANHQGFDGKGNYYSSFTIAGDAPGTTAQQNNNIDSYMTLSWNGVSFNVGELPVSNSDVGGSKGPKNVLKASGQILDMPAGSFDRLYIAGAGSNGNQVGDIILNWADGGAPTSFTQTFSDWRNDGNSTPPEGVANEKVIVEGLVVNQLGNITNENNWIYGYSFDLSGRSLSSIALPDNNNIGILGITLM